MATVGPAKGATTAQISSPQYAVFDGGLNVKDFWHKIADNELTVAQNIRLDEGGVVRMRGAWTKLASAAVGSAGNLIGLCHPSWLVAGVLTRYVVVTDGTKVFWLNGAAWTDITGAVAMSPAASTLVSFQSMSNLLIGYDGKNAPWTWDGAAASISLLGGTPPIGNIAILWQNYWFVAGVGTARARLYFSALGDPSTWPAINFIDIPSPYDGDPITGLAILYGNLIVFKRNSIYIIQGTDPTTFVVSKTNAAVGCVSPYSVVSVDNLVYFVSDKGLYALNLSNEKQICYKVQPRYDSAVNNQLSGSLARNQIQALNYRLRNEIWELADCTAAGQDQHDRTLAHNYNVVDKNGDPAVTEHFTYGSILVTLDTNDTIDFTENGGAQVSAVLTAGTYPLGLSSAESGTLCALIKTQMQGAGLLTYTVTWSATTDELTITAGSGVFVLKFASGTNTAKNSSGVMGFSGNDTASAISATGTGGVRTRAKATQALVCTAPSVMADYYSGSILPMASFYDKYVYVFNGVGTSDAVATGTAKPIQLAFTSGYKDMGDSNATKTLRNIWTSLQQSGGTPKVTIGVLGNDFSTETTGTLSPASPSTFYNVKQPAGQVFGSSPQGKFFKFGFISSDGGAFSFFQMQWDIIWNGRRN
jgi:hypothetical protein